MTKEYDRVTVVDHPMVQHKLSKLRNKDTSSKDFRALVRELALFEGYEATRDLALEDVEVETPLCKTTCKQVAGKKMVIVPILRAGLGMVNGVTNLVPAAKVGHIGLYRDPETHLPVEYYCKLPPDVGEREMLVLDPMLATGGSSIAAIDILKKHGCNTIKLVCLVGCPEGVEALQKAHPDVDLYIAAIDDHLNEHKYIVPGLGDAGDRLFGTK